MPIEGAELSTGFAARVGGIDVREPIGAVECSAVRDAIDRYGVLVFHGQRITDEQQMIFTRAFGELEGALGGGIRKASEYRLAPAMVDVSNLDKDNKVLARDDRRRLFNLGNQLWHSDGSFRTVPPTYSILSARTVASKGGNTEFANMCAAYDDLDGATKAERSSRSCVSTPSFTRAARSASASSPRRSARHSSRYGNAWCACIPRPDASRFTSPRTSAASSAGPCRKGAPSSATSPSMRGQPKYVYAHKWQPVDLVMWDNRQTMHRVRRFDETHPRDMRRTTVAGTLMTVAQTEQG